MLSSTLRFSNPKAWRAAFKPSQQWIKNILQAFPANITPPTPHVINYFCTSNHTIQRLNAVYRQKDRPTNVLSFPLQDPHMPQETPALLGDVVLAYETLVQEAHTFQKTCEAHTAHMLVHGTLHLLGFDHQASSEETIMKTHECAILEQCGYLNPYR